MALPSMEAILTRCCAQKNVSMVTLLAAQVACKVIGDDGLAASFDESVQTIRRDIMFAASLYI